MGTINSSDRIASTLYSLGTWLVSGIYVYIPCIKDIIYLPLIVIIIIIIISVPGESNGKLPLRTYPECSVSEPYRSPDWALIPAKTGPRAKY
jgi:hypothetical protein